MPMMEISYRNLCDVYFDNNRKIESLYNYVKQNYNLNDENFEEIKQKIKNIVKSFNIKYQQSYPSKNKFYIKNEGWLKNKMVLTKKSASAVGKGRPKKEFSECCKRSQRRKIQSLKCTMGENNFNYVVRSKLNREAKEKKKRIERRNTTFGGRGVSFMC